MPRASDPQHSTFIQMSRVPLVPEDVARKHNTFCSLDTRFRRAARLLQAIWLKEQNIPTGGLQTTTSAEGPTFNSFASTLTQDAAKAGLNFLSPSIHELVRRELLLREEGAAFDEERLFGNALSSQPMSFCIFGPLALDLELATRFFRLILPDFVHSVEQITWEHSPGRRDERFLNDGSAVDVAVKVVTTSGELGTVYIELKYSEGMTGPVARYRERYDIASRDTKLYIDHESPTLRSEPIEQLWREHMLTQLCVDQDITPNAVFLAIGPKLNRRVQAAFRVYSSQLLGAKDRVPFVPITLERVIDAIALAGAAETAHKLWSRYCDFGKVYQLALQELIGPWEPVVKTGSANAATSRRSRAARKLTDKGFVAADAEAAR